jgi:hypothetical protein
MTLALKNAHDAYREYENQYLKTILGSNYEDYLRLSAWSLANEKAEEMKRQQNKGGNNNYLPSIDMKEGGETSNGESKPEELLNHFVYLSDCESSKPIWFSYI